MPFEYDFTNITDYETLHEDDNQWEITQAAIFTLMFINVDSITNDNVEEVYFRSEFFTRLIRPLVKDADGNPAQITLADFIRRIGLSVNVSSMSRSLWLAKVTKTFREDTLDEARRHPAGVPA